MTEAERVFPLFPLLQRSARYYTWNKGDFGLAPLPPTLAGPGDINIEASRIPIDDDGIHDDTILPLDEWNAKVDALLEECHLEQG